MNSSRARQALPAHPRDGAEADPAFIRLDDVYKVHHAGHAGVAALGGVTLHIPHGGFAAIVGPSGAGKSTILNLIGGVETATAGVVAVAGRDLAQLSAGKRTEYRRRVAGFVWQGAAKNLLPYLTAAGNIELPLLLAGRLPAARRRRVAELLEALGLAERANHLPDTLSGGEQQRVALAVALANAPEVVLADEPTAEIDTQGARKVVEALQAASREFGATVVMATHDLDAAASADVTYRLIDGRIRAPGGRARLDAAGRLMLPPFAACLLGSREPEPGPEVEVEIEGTDLRLRRAQGSAALQPEWPGQPPPSKISPVGPQPSVGTPQPAARQHDRPPQPSRPSPEPQPLLTADGIRRTYLHGPERITALAGVSLRLRPGELVAVMGPSGSGKSTLLGVLGGFEPPDSGRVCWRGQPLAGMPAAQIARLRAAQLGVVFQALGLLPLLTARENIVLPLLVSGCKPGPAASRAGAWLDRIGLADRAEHQVNELSLGQQQRVALARALAPEPVIVLADEPTAEVDHDSAALVLEALHEVTRRGGGVILASHDPRVVHRADHVITLRDGNMTTGESGK